MTWKGGKEVEDEREEKKEGGAEAERLNQLEWEGKGTGSSLSS